MYKIYLKMFHKKYVWNCDFCFWYHKNRTRNIFYIFCAKHYFEIAWEIGGQIEIVSIYFDGETRIGSEIRCGNPTREQPWGLTSIYVYLCFYLWWWEMVYYFCHKSQMNVAFDNLNIHMPSCSTLNDNKGRVGYCFERVV